MVSLGFNVVFGAGVPIVGLQFKSLIFFSFQILYLNFSDKIWCENYRIERWDRIRGKRKDFSVFKA